MRYLLLLGGVAAMGLVPTPVAYANVVIDTTAPFSATATLRHGINYPRFLRFRVGATGGTINRIQFAPTAAQVGSGVPITGTLGEAGGGTAANVAVTSNAGQIRIVPTNNGAGTGLQSGANRLSYNEIGTTSSMPASLPAPALSNAGGTTVLVALSGTITQQTAVWTYNYLNTTVPPSGSYGANPGSGGGRVTYTASSP